MLKMNFNKLMIFVNFKLTVFTCSIKFSLLISRTPSYPTPVPVAIAKFVYVLLLIIVRLIFLRKWESISYQWKIGLICTLRPEAEYLKCLFEDAEQCYQHLITKLLLFVVTLTYIIKKSGTNSEPRGTINLIVVISKLLLSFCFLSTKKDSIMVSKGHRKSLLGVLFSKVQWWIVSSGFSSPENPISKLFLAFSTVFYKMRQCINSISMFSAIKLN